MSASFYDLLKYAATGIASLDMTYYDKMRASMLMGGAVQTLTGQPPLSFKADGSPLISWSMKGNGSQSGTPTPDNPVMPTFCGTLDSTDWTIPITCAGQTVPVYLGQTQTVRRIKKLVLTGDEDIDRYVVSNTVGFAVKNLLDVNYNRASGICTHYVVDTRGWINRLWIGVQNKTLYFVSIGDVLGIDTATEFKTYLASEYAAGHPVTIWYVLANEQTGISNEPLAKIGTYADELSSEDASVTIPTVKGDNTLTVETELQPSEMTITYKG